MFLCDLSSGYIVIVCVCVRVDTHFIDVGMFS